jgi:hypothetical protein
MDMSSTTGCLISFYGSVSSELGYDWLAWYIDGELVEGISGTAFNSQWMPFSFAVPPGAHTISWSYVKDGTGTVGIDAGWIDGVMVVNFDGTPKLAPPDVPDGILLWSHRGQAVLPEKELSEEGALPHKLYRPSTARSAMSSGKR